MAADFIKKVLRARIILTFCLLSLVSWIVGLWLPSSVAYMALPSSFGAFAHNPLTILTYMFVHAGASHLYANLLGLLLLGVPLEISGGRRLVVCALLGGGVTGGIAYMSSCTILGWHGYLCGISAATLGVACTLCIMRPWPGIILSTVVLLCLSLWGNTPPEIAAHVSGAAAGAMIALGAGLHRKRKSVPLEIAAKAERSGFASLTSAERRALMSDRKEKFSK